MSRSQKTSQKRQIEPDPKYQSIELAKFINKIMKGGKKETARLLLYRTLDNLKEKTKQDPLIIFEKAILNATPQIEVRPRRIGGATYQVPYEVEKERGKTMAMRWLVSIARKRQGKTMSEFLTEELLDASEGKGAAVEKKNQLHKLAEANKAFAHYARY
ncbi:30S ribosomal protein S7 [Candidatus Berkelbacteria bacterium]|nr:30S ribosomal protein S7 [Candidatus Berkelbacteria bacterium]MBI2588435.1 30S ribosomal protein S7 [Candidatus Berkelbacteria bacterium]MBI4029800.1 30S ribosomal protein S7 [Candidatus Berkelbacteria bacterium]